MLLLAERRQQLFLRRERHLALGERGIGGVALLAQIFQFGRERGDLFLAGAFAGFQFVQLRRQRAALLQTFLFLRGEALNFKNDRLNFLVQQPVGILQRVELAFARGDGDFLLAQFRLRLLQAGLQFRLLAQQRAAFAAHVGDAESGLPSVHLAVRRSGFCGRESKPAPWDCRCRSNNRRCKCRAGSANRRST